MRRVGVQNIRSLAQNVISEFRKMKATSPDFVHGICQKTLGIRRAEKTLINKIKFNVKIFIMI